MKSARPEPDGNDPDSERSEPSAEEVPQPEQPTVSERSVPEPVAERSTVERAVGGALYGLSLPERVARGMIGSASAVLSETASVAIPGALQRSRLYSTSVQKMLDFLVRDVGKLQQDEEGAADEGESQYLVKKAIGNAVDLAGLTVLHVSPFWVIAIFSDVALGTKTYLNALAEELKKQGVIEKSATIENLDHLLGALERTSGSLAENLDTPPVTLAELKRSVSQLRQEASRIDLTRVLSTEDVAAVWEKLESTARREGRSILEVSGAVGMMTYSQLLRAGKGAYGSVKVGFDLVHDNVVQHYVEAFTTIHQKGYYPSVLEVYGPYVQGLSHLFAARTETTTEQLLRGKPFRRLWHSVRSWWRKTSPTKRDPTPTPPEDRRAT